MPIRLLQIFAILRTHLKGNQCTCWVSALDPRYFCPAYVSRKPKRLFVSALNHAKQDFDLCNIKNVVKHAPQKLSRKPDAIAGNVKLARSPVPVIKPNNAKYSRVWRDVSEAPQVPRRRILNTFAQPSFKYIVWPKNNQASYPL